MNHELSTRLRYDQRWGRIDIRMSGMHYFHDTSINRFEVNPSFNIRIIRGLSVSLSGRYRIINDQLSLEAQIDPNDPNNIIRGHTAPNILRLFHFFRPLLHFRFDLQQYRESKVLSRISCKASVPGLFTKKFWRWARRSRNGGGNVPKYVEYTIYGTTQHTVKFRRVAQMKIEFNNMNDCKLLFYIFLNYFL